MKKLDRYIFLSMLRISVISMLLITFLLLIVELFINFQRYTTYSALHTVILLCLRIPSCLSLIAGPAVLFSTTFFISSLYSNNEFISLLSAGISYMRVIRSIIILAILYTFLFFAFNEKVKNPAEIKYDEKRAEYSSTASRFQNDSRNVAISDPENSITIKVSRYVDNDERLDGVNLITFDENGSIEKKIYCPSAKWDRVTKIWKLTDVSVFNYSSEDMKLTPEHYDEMTLTSFVLNPSYFRNKGDDIRTMKLSETRRYLKTLKTLKNDIYNEKLTEFYTRISQSVIILVMMIAAMSMNLRGKKNAMMFSLIASLALAVVYYAINMATTLMAKKSMLDPLIAILSPIVVVLGFSVLMMRRVST